MEMKFSKDCLKDLLGTINYSLEEAERDLARTQDALLRAQTKVEALRSNKDEIEKELNFLVKGE